MSDTHRAPPSIAWPWPPPISLAVLNELRAALLGLPTAELGSAVPAAERESFDSAPLEWCITHREQGQKLLALGLNLMRGFEFFRKFRPGT